MRLFDRCFGGRRPPTARRHRVGPARRPSLETLEDRTVPAILASELIPAVTPPPAPPPVEAVVQPPVTALLSGAPGSTAPEQPPLPNVPPGGGGILVPPVQPGGGDMFIPGDSGQPNDPPPGNPDPRAGFVQGLYQESIGRAANDSEVAGWLSALDRYGRQAVVIGITQSFEAEDHLVQSWYVRFLGRPAQGGEELGWVDQLQHGAEMESVITAMVSSQEFFARAGGSNDGFVNALYDQFLNRACSPAECAGWVRALAQSGRQGVITAIQHSTEFRTAVVEDFYQTLLGRTGSQAEVAGWVYSHQELCEILPLLQGSDEFFVHHTTP